MVALVRQQSSAVKQLQCASAAMAGVVLFVLNQLISAKVNRVIMVERVNQARDGFDVPVHRVSLDQIAV